MKHDRRIAVGGITAALLTGWAFAPAVADDQMYKGKTITIMVGYAAGGGSDLAGRLFARHLGNHIPGKPNVVVKNMPGAGGMIALNYVGEGAKPDGYTAFFGTAPVEMQLLGDPALKVDISKFEFIAGTPGTQVFYIRADAKPGIKAPEDLFKVEGLVVGGFRYSSVKDMSERMALDLLGIKYRYVTGFTGNSQARAAVQQGTVNSFLEGLPSYNGVTVPTMVKTGLVVPIFQLGIPGDKTGTTERDRDAKDVPTVEELFVRKNGKPPSGDKWQAYLALTAPYSISQRWLGLPPGTPKQPVSILRAASMKLNDDKAFKEDMMKVLKFDLAVYPGERAEQAIRSALAVTGNVKQILKDHADAGKQASGR